jgi:hypothetical protein
MTPRLDSCKIHGLSEVRTVPDVSIEQCETPISER